MEILLDGRKMKNRKTVHEYIKQQFHFPDYYGKNLDALNDMLLEIGEQTSIEICHVEKIDELEEYGKTMLKVFMNAAKMNPNLHITINL